MTNYDGRSHYATLGKDPVTPKEPLSWTYHKSCEKLYQLHRERVTFVEHKVDDRQITYDFMHDNSFKEKAKQFQELRLMKENQIIYGRICKVEGQESRISKDAREHAKRVQVVRETDHRLRSMGRKRVQDKIERENVYFHQRINKVQPFYSRKKMSDDYKHHELFKRGRKSLPCAGHLLKCDRTTAPKRLAPVLSLSGPLSPEPSLFSQTRASTQGSLAAGGSQLSQFPSVSSYTEPFLLPVPKQLSPIRSKSQGGGGGSPKKKNAPKELPQQLSMMSSFETEDGDGGDTFDSFAMPSEQTRAELSQSAAQFEETHLKLYSKSIPLPLETNQCSIRVYASVMYDEHLYLRCCALSDPNVVLASRQMTLDQAFDMVKTIKKEEHSAADFHNIRDKLSKMFEEADTEHRGYLTYAEFETLMSKIDIGISSQELRFVIQEADENQNGFVDYNEFIPLAVDMILAFHSRTRAIESQNQLEVSVDDEVLHQLSKSNIDAAASLALEKIRAADNRSSGSIRPAELRRILKSIASKDAASGLSDNEISMVLQTLARDPFGKVIYSNFAETLREVCFNSLKNMIIQSQGSDLQNYLTEMFKTEEARLLLEQGEAEPTSFTGLLPFRTVITLMSGSQRLSLSRLQVMVIASSAEVEDGNVNYYKFAPAASKTIELMFQPHILRQRAELIETTELSPTHLLNGASPEEFLRKLRTLFSSYDLGRTGQLNPRQFRAIMDSMELQLTPGEIMALMSAADTDNSGGIDFDEFAEFCMTNLLHLEREKHIRLLQDAMNGGSDQTGDSEETHRLESHLLNIFQLADHDNSGNLSYDELEVVFQSVNIHMSQFQLQVLLSEMDANNDGSVSYEEFIPAAADLLQAYRAKSHAVEEKRRREEWAAQKASEAEHDWIVDVRKSVTFLFDKLTLIADTIEDVASKRNAVLEVLRHPNSGLNRTEANMLLAKLYPRQDGGYDEDIMSVSSTHTKGSITVTEQKLNDHHQNALLNLENLISEIRKMTIMRGFLEALPASSIAEHLMHLFESEASRLESEKVQSKTKRSAEEGVEEEAPSVTLTLPLSSVFSVLEKNTQVRLNRTQILGILSWSDCYEQGNTSEINCKRFAVYAADVIAKLNNPEQMLKRATVVKNAKMDPQTVMNGATQAEVDDYYFTAFSAVAHEKDFLEERDVLKIIRGVPRVSLSDKEALALSAAIPLHPDIGYDWRQFLPSAYLATAEICRERLIARRITLMGASEMNAEDRLALQRVAEGVANLVTLRRSRGKLYIVLPTDTSQGRKSSLLHVKNGNSEGAELESFEEELEGQEEAEVTGSNSFNRRVARQESSGIFNEDKEGEDELGELRSDKGVVKGRNKAYSRSYHQAAPEAYDILRMGKRMPVIGITVPGESVEAAMNRYLGEGAADKIKGEWIYLLVKFMENDPLLCPDATPLKIVATTLDCSKQFNIPVTLRLPSVGAVDGDAAKQFARNIMEKLYLEKYKGVLHLRIYDKKEVVISNEPERSTKNNKKSR